MSYSWCVQCSAMALCNLYWWAHQTGTSEAGRPGASPPPPFLADQLPLSQPGGADYAHHSTTFPLGFLTLAASLPPYSDLSFTECVSTKIWWILSSLKNWGGLLGVLFQAQKHSFFSIESPEKLQLANQKDSQTKILKRSNQKNTFPRPARFKSRSKFF